ncbi:hypothetical protein CMUS01_13897 [Colletotrichum musicola]|uniref:Uncharacterized protein n=1 Tax=Colletotrichum musicola TaxID=2175873 RepID=A0A8H6J8G9_9PEZI|nr:hypothetical protein CMUS01_13897 [Colletotrichum musicola]
MGTRSRPARRFQQSSLDVLARTMAASACLASHRAFIAGTVWLALEHMPSRRSGFGRTRSSATPAADAVPTALPAIAERAGRDARKGLLSES